MNELITADGTLMPDTADRLVKLSTRFNKVADEMESLKAAILAEMERKNIIKVETPKMEVTYIAPTTRESIDTKALKAECPEVADAYTKIMPVKSSVRIKLK